MAMPMMDGSGGFGPLAISGYAYPMSLPMMSAGTRFAPTRQRHHGVLIATRGTRSRGAFSPTQSCILALAGSVILCHL